ncbi:MAG: cytidylyltransferase domain-containing protein [Steroidobacteraceae bacterium]
MINERSVLGVITARGGSKGLPGKNIRPLGGKPLLAWTVEAARASRYMDRVITTTDDDSIAEIARSYGSDVPFRRHASLASDHTTSVEVVLDALERCPGYDYVVLLQPTSPLRTERDIDGALELCDQAAAPACVSVCRAAQSPYWMFTVGSDKSIKPLFPDRLPARRQDLPAVYSLNGAVYVAVTERLRAERTFITSRTVAYEMPADRSVDIDAESDLQRAESCLKARQR